MNGDRYVVSDESKLSCAISFLSMDGAADKEIQLARNVSFFMN